MVGLHKFELYWLIGGDVWPGLGIGGKVQGGGVREQRGRVRSLRPPRSL